LLPSLAGSKPENIMNPEQNQQLFLDGMQSVDVERVMGNPHQKADLSRIEQASQALGSLISQYATRWGGMPTIRQTNGVDDKGLPYSELSIKE